MVAKRRVLDEAIRDVSLAWHIAALQRQKRLQALKSIVNDMDPTVHKPSPQTLDALAELYGLKVRKRKQKGTQKRG